MGKGFPGLDELGPPHDFLTLAVEVQGLEDDTDLFITAS